MWLVDVRTYRLEEFSGSEVPKYAILSHTWEEEEVTFQEIHRRSALSKKGYAKIKETCIRARRHGLHYAWIDTCCTIQTHHRRQRPTKRVAYAAENGGRTALCEGVGVTFEAVPAGAHDINTPDSILSYPDISFSAQIDQLKEENARLSQELRKWRENAAAESERRQLAEEQARQLHDTH
ncbi:Vegetative incompatibility protein HET-E-1 [Lachnellula willkommii]|uniref:Vegetative incompatibility protein HET-E-1 n=1 Tax=Lachnellula willkommii TaxID=215461 RepID=A0A559MKK0_9HELO|nr:Vegetative incompatibility protein HET-E-1 [Lachnellula willkommii]